MELPTLLENTYDLPLSQSLLQLANTWIEAELPRIPIYQEAIRFDFDRSRIQNYLINVQCLLEYTPIHTILAHRRALELGDTNLAKFYHNKSIEEAGHREWAVEDLSHFNVVLDNAEAKASSHIMSLRHLIENMITRHPINYLAYIFLAEYITVKAGPIFLSRLIAGGHISANQMSSIHKHAVLDQDHVLDDLELMNRLGLSHTQEREMLDYARQALETLTTFYRSL